jgi:hypothetical protein
MEQSFSVSQKTTPSVEPQFQKEQVAERVDDILLKNEIDSA